MSFIFDAVDCRCKTNPIHWNEMPMKFPERWTFIESLSNTCITCQLGQAALRVQWFVFRFGENHKFWIAEISLWHKLCHSRRWILPEDVAVRTMHTFVSCCVKRAIYTWNLKLLWQKGWIRFRLHHKVVENLPTRSFTCRHRTMRFSEFRQGTRQMSRRHRQNVEDVFQCVASVDNTYERTFPEKPTSPRQTLLTGCRFCGSTGSQILTNFPLTVKFNLTYCWPKVCPVHRQMRDHACMWAAHHQLRGHFLMNPHVVSQPLVLC